MKEGICVISDLHINSLTGLGLRSVRLDDGHLVQTNKIRRWLTYTFEKFLDDVKDVLKQYGVSHTTLIVGGEIADCDEYDKKMPLITKNRDDILNHACEFMEPVVGEFDEWLAIRGTPAHSGDHAWLDERIGKDLGAIKIDGNCAHYYFRGAFEKVTFDVAHHASMGQLPWTRGTSATKYAATTVWNYEVDWKEPAPQIVIRGHNHRWADSGTTYKSRVFGAPGWQLPNGYIHRIGKSSDMPHIGGFALICENGEYVFPKNAPLLYKPPRSKAWTRK